MKRILDVSAAVFLSGGCAITDRLDATNQQLGTANAQSREANQRLADAQIKLDGAIQRLDTTVARLDETNRKLNTVEQAILQTPILRPDPHPAAPVPGISTPQAR